MSAVSPSATNGQRSLTVSADTEIVRLQIVEGFESRHYGEKTPVPVLEAEVRKACTLTSEYRFFP